MLPKRAVNVWLNGASLRDLDSRIILRTVEEDTPQVETAYGDIPGGHGQRFISLSRKNRRVSVVFAVRELYDLSARAQVIDAVNAWARDGVLEVSYRPGQRLRVRRINPAAIGDARDYTAEYRVDFDAPACPFWEDFSPTVLTLSAAANTEKTGTLPLGGSAPTVCDVTVTPSASLTSLSVSFGSSTLSFTGLSVASGTAVKIAHDDDGILTIKAGTTSIMNKRTAASSDDLAGGPGATALAVTADAACSVTFSARGRWK